MKFKLNIMSEKTICLTKIRNCLNSVCGRITHFSLDQNSTALPDIGPSNKYIFRVGIGDILILLTV
jgi:hypothetical protein